MRGRGHTKESDSPQHTKTTKISTEHGQPVIRLPSNWEKLGVKLEQDITVVISKKGNVLNWEITIKPANNSIGRQVHDELLSRS